MHFKSYYDWMAVDYPEICYPEDISKFPKVPDK